MRLFSLLALAALANAQYFSEGWKPGQKVQETQTVATGYYDPSETASSSTDTAEQPERTPFSLSNLFDVNKILGSGPVASLFSKAGINITEKIASAEEARLKLWDDRIPLITDENFDEIIVNESLTPQEEEDRVWVLVITISSSSREESVSKLVDKMIDSAYDKSVIEGDLPNVRWGRINYLSVTAITTKWGIWRAPYLVLLRKRGKSLRFFSPYNIRVNDDVLREFLLSEGWRAQQPWSTSFAPGGHNEYIMDFMAKWMTKVYNVFVVVPNWVILAGSTMLASFLIRFMHRGSDKKAEQKKTEAVKAPAAPAVKKQASAGPSTAAPVASPSGATTAASPAPVTSTPKKKQKKTLTSDVSTSAATDSEQESGANQAKRSTRQRRTKK